MSPHRALGLAWEALLLELALYRSLARWLVRRPDIPAGAVAIGYAELIGPMLWLWIFGSATEVVVVEVVLQSIDAAWAEALRLPLLGLGIWGLLWMLGMLAAYRVRPHLLMGDHLQIRNGARTWVTVPLDAITGVHTTEHEFPGITKVMHHEDELLLVGVGRRTNVELTLSRPSVLHTSAGPRAASKIGLWVDEPQQATRQLKAPNTTSR